MAARGLAGCGAALAETDWNRPVMGRAAFIDRVQGAAASVKSLTTGAAPTVTAFVCVT